MLLHETRNDDGIRSFFNDVWECYIKTLLNPFYAVDKSIKSSTFENRVRTIAKVSFAISPITDYSDTYDTIANSRYNNANVYTSPTRCLLFHSQNRRTFS